MSRIRQSSLNKLSKDFINDNNNLDWTKGFKLIRNVKILEDFCDEVNKNKANYAKENPEITDMISELNSIKKASEAVAGNIKEKEAHGGDLTTIRSTLIGNFDNFKEIVIKLSQVVLKVNKETSLDTAAEMSDQWTQTFLGNYFDIILHVGTQENIFTTLNSAGSPLKYLEGYRSNLYLISDYFKLHYLTRADDCPDQEIKEKIGNLLAEIDTLVEGYTKIQDVMAKRARINLHHPKLKKSVQEIYKQTLIRCGHE